MLEELSKKRSLAARIGLEDTPGPAAPHLRALLAFLSEVPVAGWPAKAFKEALEALSKEEDDLALERRFDDLFAVGRQTYAQIDLLAGLARAIHEQQGELVTAIRAAGLPAAPGPLTELAKEAALAAYRGRVANDHQYADHRGIEGGMREEHVASLPLDEVYVLPRLLSEREHPGGGTREAELVRRLMDEEDRASPQIARIVDELEALRRARWRPGGAAEAGRALRDVLPETRHVVVLGGPGVGKSTLMRYLARVCALGAEAMEAGLGWGEALVPVLVPLARFGEARRARAALTLRAWVDEEMEARGGPALRAAVGEALEEGRAMVLLDGVDEVPDDRARSALVQAVDTFLSAHAAARIVVTSRPYGYARVRGEVPHFTLPNFSPAQVEEFVGKWQRARERREHPEAPDLRRAEAEAEGLLDEIRRNPRVAELATNPLMLVIVSLFRQERVRLPEERVQLYDKAVRTLLNTWSQWRTHLAPDPGGTVLPPGTMLRVWGAVAEWMRRERNTGVVPRGDLQRKLVEILRDREEIEGRAEETADAYLRAAANRAGILEERGRDLFAFWHPTFEEYLAAVELCTPGSKAVERVLAVCDDPRWREVVLLAVGYLGTVQNDPATASTLVDALLETRLPPSEPFLHGRLRLAAAAVAEGRAVRRSCAERVIRSLVEAVRETPFPGGARVLAETLRAVAYLRISAETVEALAPVAEALNQDLSLEAARTIADVADRYPRAAELCEAWDEPWGRLQEVALLGLARAGRQDGRELSALVLLSSYRAPMPVSVRALLEDRIGLLEPYLASTSDEERLLASELLLMHGMEDERAMDTLGALTASGEWTLRWRAASALARAGKADALTVEVLGETVRGEARLEAYVAADFLHSLGEHEEVLLEALRARLAPDAEPSWMELDLVRRFGWADRVADVLSGWLDEPTWWRPFQAAHLLWTLESRRPEVRARLLGRLDDPEVEVRLRAAEALVDLDEGCDQTRATLWRIVQEENEVSAFRAAMTLWEAGESEDELWSALRPVLLGKDYNLKETWSNWLRDKAASSERAAALIRRCAMQENPRISTRFNRDLLGLRRADVEVAVRVAQAHPAPRAAADACRRVDQRASMEERDYAALLALVSPAEDDSAPAAWARQWLYKWMVQRMEPQAAA